MATRSEKVMVGSFTTLAIALLVGVTFWLLHGQGGEDRLHYFVEFSESVAGLRNQSEVKYLGVPVGHVESVEFDPQNISRVRVLLALEPGTPVQTDTTAVLKSSGITGGIFIDLVRTQPGAPALPAGRTIPSQPSLMQTVQESVPTVAQKTQQLLERLNDVLSDENRDVFAALLRDLARSITQGPGQVERGLGVLEGTAERFAKTAETVDAFVRQVDGLVAENRAQIHEITLALSATLQEIQTLLGPDGVQKSFAEISRSVALNERSVRRTLANLEETSRILRAFARRVEEDPSRLIRTAPRRPRVLSEGGQ